MKGKGLNSSLVSRGKTRRIFICSLLTRDGPYFISIFSSTFFLKFILYSLLVAESLAIIQFPGDSAETVAFVVNFLAVKYVSSPRLLLSLSLLYPMWVKRKNEVPLKEDGFR